MKGEPGNGCGLEGSWSAGKIICIIASGNYLHESKREWSQPWARSKCQKRQLSLKWEEKNGEVRKKSCFVSSYIKGFGGKEQKLTNLTSNSLDGFYSIERKDKEPDPAPTPTQKKQKQVRFKQQKISCGHTRRTVWLGHCSQTLNVSCPWLRYRWLWVSCQCPITGVSCPQGRASDWLDRGQTLVQLPESLAPRFTQCRMPS